MVEPECGQRTAETVDEVHAKGDATDRVNDRRHRVLQQRLRLLEFVAFKLLVELCAVADFEGEIGKVQQREPKHNRSCSEHVTARTAAGQNKTTLLGLLLVITRRPGFAIHFGRADRQTDVGEEQNHQTDFRDHQQPFVAVKSVGVVVVFFFANDQQQVPAEMSNKETA